MLTNIYFQELTHEDEERRKRRRERNKIAATKCRNKKKERTTRLIAEGEVLTIQNAGLKEELRKLKAEKRSLSVLMSQHESSCVKNAKSQDCSSDSKQGHKRKLVETGGHCYQSRARHDEVYRPSVRSRGCDQYENDYESYDIKQECDPCQWPQPWSQPWPHGGQQPQHGGYPIKNNFFDSQSLCLSNYNMNGVDQMCLAL